MAGCRGCFFTSRLRYRGMDSLSLLAQLSVLAIVFTAVGGLLTLLGELLTTPQVLAVALFLAVIVVAAVQFSSRRVGRTSNPYW